MAWWIWVCFFGGAELIAERWWTRIVIHWVAARWDDEQIKLFGWCSMPITTLWFILGLIYPEIRFAWNAK